MLGKVLWCMVTGKLKLHREDFLDPRLDVTKLFPNDPDMYMINEILKKSVVTRESDCLPSAVDLWLVVDAYWKMMMQRGGQLWRDGIPKPCRVCGVGSYQPQQRQQGQPDASIAVALNRFVNGIDQHIGALRMTSFICDRCGHVQLFRA